MGCCVRNNRAEQSEGVDAMTTRDNKLRAVVAEMYGIPHPLAQSYARAIDKILGPRVAEPAAEGVTEKNAARYAWLTRDIDPVLRPIYEESIDAALTLAGEKK